MYYTFHIIFAPSGQRSWMSQADRIMTSCHLSAGCHRGSSIERGQEAQNSVRLCGGWGLGVNYSPNISFKNSSFFKDFCHSLCRL